MDIVLPGHHGFGLIHQMRLLHQNHVQRVVQHLLWVAKIKKKVNDKTETKILKLPLIIELLTAESKVELFYLTKHFLELRVTLLQVSSTILCHSKLTNF